MASHSSRLPSLVRSVVAPPPNPSDDLCPLCEQPIPHDRAHELAERLRSRETERAAEIAAELQAQFVAEKAEVLRLAESEALEKVEQARSEAKLAAEAEATTKIASAERLQREAAEALQAKTDEAALAKANADAAYQAQLAELEKIKRDASAALEKAAADAAAKEESIRAEAARVADEAARIKIEAADKARTESEASLTARIEEIDAQRALAQESNVDLQTRLDQSRRSAEEAIERMKQDAAARELTIKVEANAAAEASVQEKLSAADQARLAAEQKATAAESQVQCLAEAHETQLAERLREQREALENAQVALLNTERSAAFEEKQKLANKVDELKRALEKKTADELGEGAEIDLFEALQAEFAGDKIERVNRGQPGADILHTVVHNGRDCGTIIYDSKNHAAWRNEFVTKLSSDQLAAKAAHAILSTHKFPAGTRQLHVQDGVVIATPARVVALVEIVRAHLIQSHTLRMSGQEREQKTAQLYAFITSQRCSDLLARVDTHAEDLLDIQVKEKKAHEANWRRQGELIRSVQKVRSELSREIDDIIGTPQPHQSA